MEDRQIIELYWERAEEAIRETDVKYGRLCRYIAQNILASPEDSEECVNDAWLGLWNAIPPKRPERFSAFVGRVARNLALKRFDYLTAAKRSPEAVCSLEELGECVPSVPGADREVEDRELERMVDRFLHTLPERACSVFLRRYWYAESMEDIAGRYGMGVNTVKTSLFRTRRKLKAYLEKEGIAV